MSRRNAAATAALVFALMTTGCAAQQGDYGADIADRLQAEVLEVSQLSAAADFAGALQSLTELEVDLKDALARRTLTKERYEAILAATALVKADLQAAIAAQAPPPPEVNTGGDGDDDGTDDSGNNGNGNSGKGNGNNGNNGNNGKGNGGKGNDD